MANGIFKHQTFKRSYREDYLRELDAPSVGYHVFYAFKMIFSNFKILFPILLLATLIEICLVGFIDLKSFSDIGTAVVTVLIFLMIFIMTIFVLRQKMANNVITLRDTLYNSMTPMTSVLVVLIIVAIQCVPIIITIVAYNSAVETHFLDTPFYAFLFWGFSALLVLLSIYLLSSTIMALTAVTAPGLYPLEALKAASEMMRGRRIRFAIRFFVFVFVILVMWVILVWPFVYFLGQSPITSVMLTILGCFSAMYFSAYFYVFYRWMIGPVEKKKEENGKRKSRKKNS